MYYSLVLIGKIKSGGQTLEVIFIIIILKTVILNEIIWGERVDAEKGWLLQHLAGKTENSWEIGKDRR